MDIAVAIGYLEQEITGQSELLKLIDLEVGKEMRMDGGSRQLTAEM